MTEARAEIGIIGGTGFYRFLEDAEEIEVETPFGAPSSRDTASTTASLPIRSRTAPTCGR